MTSRKLTAADLDALHPGEMTAADYDALLFRIVRVNKPGEEIIFLGREPNDPLEVIRAELETAERAAWHAPRPTRIDDQPSPASWRWSDLVVALVFVGTAAWFVLSSFPWHLTGVAP